MLRFRSRFSIALLLGAFALLARPAAAGVDRWTPIGPDGGTVLSFAVRPGAPGTLYAGTEGGGVWKSLDAGAHWASASEGLTAAHGFGASDVLVLAAAPSPSDAVFAGTRGGLFRSRDGGATWRRVLDAPESFSWTLAISPTDPSRILAGIHEDLWISEDGGDHWQLVHVMPGNVSALVFDPADPSTVYAAAGALRVSRDAGATWRPLTAEFGPSIDDKHALHLAVDPADPRTLYAGTEFHGLWKSADRGATWRRLEGIGSNIRRLLLDPADPAVLLAHTHEAVLLRSEDAGATWEEVHGLPALQVFALAADPGLPGTLWLGNHHRGVFRSLDSGRTWTPSRRGLAATHVLAAAFDPFRPRTLYASANALGVYRSPDAGAAWTRISDGLSSSPGYGVTALSLAPHPLRPGTLFAGTNEGVYRSLDRGTHWSLLRTLYSGDVNTIAFDPRRPDSIFAAGDYLFRSRTGGRTWKLLPFPATQYEPEVRKLVVSPLRPQTLFLLDFNQRRGEARSLFRSTDGGATWQLVFDRGPIDLAPHPTRPGVLYVASHLGSEIWKSEDDGLTWELVTATIPGNRPQLSALLVDRLDPSILYLGTFGSGVLRSTDGGVTWAALSAGMIAPRITCLAADPRNPRRIVACTQGGGLLEIRLSSAP